MAGDERPKPGELTKPPPKFERITAAERDNEERKRWDEDRVERAQTLKQRKHFAFQVFWLVVVWHVAVIAFLVRCQFALEQSLEVLPQSVLVALTSTTTANVLASLVIVLRFVFPAKKEARAATKKLSRKRPPRLEA
jgi:hypothetical protein